MGIALFTSPKRFPDDDDDDDHDYDHDDDDEHTATRASMSNNNNVRVPTAYGHQSTHAQTIITLVFQEHTVTRNMGT